MAAPIVMAKVKGATQVSQLLASSGSKTFTVGKVTTAAAAGGSSIVSLTPTAGGTAIAVKLEGARQAAELSPIVGKTVAIGKPSTLVGAGAGNNWLMLQPVQAGATKASVSTATMLKLEGTNQGIQAAALSGKEFTVVKPLMAGNQTASTLFLQPTAEGNLISLKMANAAPAASSMVGKTVVIGQAPIVSGGAQGSWLVLKPMAGATIGKAAGGTVAAKAAGTAASKAAGGTVAAKTMGAAGVAGVAAGATGPTAAGAAAAGAGGAMAHTTGLSLALGFLGGLGPVILTGVGIGAVYGIWRNSLNNRKTGN